MGNEEIEQIREKVERHSLTMSRVPKKTKLRFQEIAVDFEDDYGLCLKAILDKFDSQNYLQEMICAKILEIDERLKSLEVKPDNEKKPQGVKTLSGRVIAKEVKDE